jgi:hypothetical protein
MVSIRVALQFTCFALVFPEVMAFAFGDFPTFYPAHGGSFYIVVTRLVLLTIVSWRIAILSHKPIKNLSRSLFYVFLYVWLIIVPSIQWFYREWPWALPTQWQDDPGINVLILISIVAFEAGYARYVGRDRRTLEHLRPVDTAFSVRRVKIFLMMYALYFIYFVAAHGGPMNFLVSRVDNPIYDAGSNTALHMITAAVFSTTIGVLCLILFDWYVSGRSKTIKGFMYFGFAGAIMLAVADFPLSIPRAQFGALVIAFSMIWMTRKRNHVFAAYFPLIMVAGIFVVYPIFGLMRATIGMGGFDRRTFTHGFFTGDFDVYQMLGTIVGYTNTHGVTWGRQLLGAMLFWVPRSIWPDKPIGTGAMVAKSLGSPFTNLSAPLWAEGYVNFGVVGTLCMFIGLGFFLRRMSKETVGSGSVRLVLGAYVVGFQMFILRGDLMSSLAFLTPVAALIASLIRRVRYSDKEPDVPSRIN